MTVKTNCDLSLKEIAMSSEFRPISSVILYVKKKVTKP